MIKTKIEQALKETFKPVYLKVIDESAKHAGHAVPGQGGNFAVEIVSDAFMGKKPLERHRMVYAALEPVKTSIHSLAIKVKTPRETVC